MKRYIRSSTSDMSVEERIRLAMSSNDPEILAKLVDDEAWDVRIVVARRTDDPEVLAKLAEDEDVVVRHAATERINQLRSSRGEQA